MRKYRLFVLLLTLEYQKLAAMVDALTSRAFPRVRGRPCGVIIA